MIFNPDTRPTVPLGVLRSGEPVRGAGWREILARQGWYFSGRGYHQGRHWEPQITVRNPDFSTGDEGQLESEAWLSRPSRQEVDAYEGQGYYLIEVGAYLQSADLRLRGYEQIFSTDLDPEILNTSAPLYDYIIEREPDEAGWTTAYFLIEIPADGCLRWEPEIRNNGSIGILRALYVREWRVMSPDTYRGDLLVHGSPLISADRVEGQDLELLDTGDASEEVDFWIHHESELPILRRSDPQYGIQSAEVYDFRDGLRRIRSNNQHDLSSGGLIAGAYRIASDGSHDVNAFNCGNGARIFIFQDQITAQGFLAGGAQAEIQVTSAYTQDQWVDLVFWWDDSEGFWLWIDGEEYHDSTSGTLQVTGAQTLMIPQTVSGEVEGIRVCMPMAMGPGLSLYDARRVVAWRRSEIGIY